MTLLVKYLAVNPLCVIVYVADSSLGLTTKCVILLNNSGAIATDINAIPVILDLLSLNIFHNTLSNI